MPYKTKNGRRFQLGRGATNGLQRAVKLEGSVVTFECKKGHQMKQDFSKGRAKMSEGMLKKFAGYWGLGTNPNGTQGHCYGWCQKCQNETDGVK